MVDLGLGQEHKNIRPFKQTVNTWWAISLGQTQSLWAQQCAWRRGYWQSFICINKRESHFCIHEGKQEQGGRVNPPEGSTCTICLWDTHVWEDQGSLWLMCTSHMCRPSKSCFCGILSPWYRLNLSDSLFCFQRVNFTEHYNLKQTSTNLPWRNLQRSLYQTVCPMLLLSVLTCMQAFLLCCSD